MMMSVCFVTYVIRIRAFRLNRGNQTKKMKDKSVQHFKLSHAGDTVMVPLLFTDSRTAECANAKANIVLAMDGSNYKVRTKHGLIKQVYTCN